MCPLSGLTQFFEKNWQHHCVSKTCFGLIQSPPTVTGNRLTKFLALWTQGSFWPRIVIGRETFRGVPLSNEEPLLIWRNFVTNLLCSRSVEALYQRYFKLATLQKRSVVPLKSHKKRVWIRVTVSFLKNIHIFVNVLEKQLYNCDHTLQLSACDHSTAVSISRTTIIINIIIAGTTSRVIVWLFSWVYFYHFQLTFSCLCREPSP